jgi:hypothetical protein
MVPCTDGVSRSNPLTQHENACNCRKALIVKDQRWNREIDENSRREAKGGGMSETVAGAVLGGLILGPFGKNDGSLLECSLVRSLNSN